MYWVYVLLALYVLFGVYFIVGVLKGWGFRFANVSIVCAVMLLSLFLSLVTIQSNIESKHDWYIEICLVYAEADGIEQEYLEMTDVYTYNLWFERNKADLENPWNLKNAAGCEFDYIKIKGD